MEQETFVGIDIGTSKICTLVARLNEDGQLHILGVGIEASRGIRRGVVVDLAAASDAIGRSIGKAERTAGVEINSALVSLAGTEISGQNSKGVVGISGRVIDAHDINRAVEAARAVAIPHNREIIHVVQRNFTVDGQDGVRTPIGMHGYRLEVEVHIITAAASLVDNLRECVAASGVHVSQFVLNPLASGEVVVSDTEREMGVVVCDIGAGTTDIAIYIEGDVWHTAVLNIGGDFITSDIAHGLRMPIEQAERVKVRNGHAVMADVAAEEFFTVKAFGEENPIQVSRVDLAHIIEARVEEIFSMVLQEIKRSGYDGLLPAGMVLTGGTSMLPGIRKVANAVLGLPVRLGKPENLRGLKDRLESPAFSTSVGMLEWARIMNEFAHVPRRSKSFIDWDKVKEFFLRFFP